jgi:hypothetical protein
MPIVFTLLLVSAAAHRHSFWGYLWQLIFGGIVLLGAYSTFSPKEIAAEIARRPGTTRSSILVTTGVPYVLVPTIGWVLAIPLGWGPGALVPLLPWAALLVFAAIALGFDKLRPKR